MSDGKVTIETDLDRSGAEKGVNALGSSLKSGLGKAAGVAIKGTAVAIGSVTTAIAGVTTASTKAYASYEQLVGGVDTLFKKSSKQLQQYADNAYKTAQMSANDYMETATSFSASLLQGLGGDTEKAAKLADKAIIDMSDNANKMGTDIELIKNAYQGFAKGNFTMLDNLKLGYGGTKTEMARLINDMGILNEKVTVGKKGNFETVASFDVMIEAIHKAQTQLGIAGTSAKEAGSTIEGSMNMAKASWENFLTALGTGDDSRVKDALDQLISSVGTATSNLIPRIKTIVETLGSAITEYLPPLVQKVVAYLVSGLPNVINTITKLTGSIIEGLRTAISANLPQILEAAGQLIEFLVNGLLQMSQSSSEGLTSFITTMIQFIVDTLVENVPTLITAVVNMFTLIIQSLPKVLPVLVEGLLNLIPALIDALFQSLPILIEGLVQLVNGIVAALPQIIESILAALPGIITSITNGLMNALPLIVQAGVSLLMGLVDAIPQVIQAIVQNLPKIIQSIVTLLITAVPEIVKASITLFMAILDALPEIIIELVNAIPQIIDAISGTLTGNSDDIFEAGIQIFTMLIEAISKALPKILAAVPKIIISIVKCLIKGQSKIVKVGFDLIVSLFKNLPGMLVALGKGVVSIVTGIISAFKGYVGEFVNIGKDLIKGIGDGFSKAFSYIGDKAKSAKDWVVDKFKGLFDIHSPSKVMREQVGKYVAEGVVVGYEDVDPFGQIQRDLDSGISKLTLSAQNEVLANTNIAKSGLTNSMVDAIKKSNLGIYVGEKQFGRLVERGLASL